MKQQQIFLSLLFLLSVLTCRVAEAHRDYLIKETTLQTEHGKILVEKHFGDGIIVSDPLSVQIRNAQGEVVAHTPISYSIAVLCPSLDFCLAIPHGALTVWSRPWKLVAEKIDWKKAPMPGATPSTELVEYLTSDARRRTIADGEYLDREREMKGFERTDSLYFLLSPLFLIACYFPMLLLVFFMGAAPYWLLIPFNEKFKHPLAKIIIFCLSCSYTVIVFALLLGTLFISTPFAYMVMFFAIGLSLSHHRYIKRKFLRMGIKSAG